MDAKKFQKSITLELETLKNRVRNIIDDRHWLSDGEFKEAILRNVLKRNLPSNLSIGAGFVINSQTMRMTTQIDLIIYENEYPPLFLEGDFIITESTGVKGIIEVKTKLGNTQIREAVQKLNNNVDVINGYSSKSKLKFTGLFCYEYEGFSPNEESSPTEIEYLVSRAKQKLESEIIDNALKASNGRVNHLSLGKDFFIKFWKRDCHIHNKPTERFDFYNLYHLPDLGYSYFISNVYELCSTVSLFGRQWFSFPIDGGKESYRFRELILD